MSCTQQNENGPGRVEANRTAFLNASVKRRRGPAKKFGDTFTMDVCAQKEFEFISPQGLLVSFRSVRNVALLVWGWPKIKSRNVWSVVISAAFSLVGKSNHLCLKGRSPA